jgi:hypothetical protein
MPISYTTGNTKGGQTYEEFVGEEKMDAMGDLFDDFLNECFCKSQSAKENNIGNSPNLFSG